jgi:hypothetical protein
MPLPRSLMSAIHSVIAKPKSPTIRDTASIPFWNLRYGEEMRIRLLPDKDENRPWPFVEKKMITLPFQGQIGGDYATTDEVEGKFACPEMFGLTCPSTQALRPYWSDPVMRAEASKRYRKIVAIWNCYVCTNPLTEEVENPIRRLHANRSLQELLLMPFGDTEAEFSVLDPIEGRDFVIVKSQNGQWASYQKSHYAFKSRALSDGETAAIDKWGLHNLIDELGPCPSAEAIAALGEMTKDSLNGLPFNYDKYSPFGYRVFKVGGFAGNDAPAPALVASPDVVTQLRQKNRSTILPAMGK